jgi:uncharacterized membrane protein YcaP (DUF421 family)
MPLTQQLWSSLAQTGDVAVRTVVAYVVALVLVRLAGRRTLAQLSAFDIVVTIAAGTVVGSTALPSSPAVSDGITVLVTLMVLQVVLGAARQRSSALRRVLDFAPRPVVRDGRLDLRRSPTSAQLTRTDVEALLRRQGVSDLAEVRLAVLEPTGKLSVLQVGDQPVGLFSAP